MGVQIKMPEQKQDSSVGRRLFAMAAPIAGGAIGGPAGAALGGMIGGKIAGASTKDAMLSGAQAGLGAIGKKPVPGVVDTPDPSSMARRMDALTQNPDIAIHQGLEVASSLPPGMKEQYLEPLVKAQMMLGRRA